MGSEMKRTQIIILALPLACEEDTARLKETNIRMRELALLNWLLVLLLVTNHSFRVSQRQSYTVFRYCD